MADQFQINGYNSYSESISDLGFVGSVLSNSSSIVVSGTGSRADLYPYQRKAISSRNFTSNFGWDDFSREASEQNVLMLFSTYLRLKNHNGLGSPIKNLHNIALTDSEELFDSYHISPVDIIATNGTTLCKESDKVVDLRDSIFINDGAVTPSDIESDVGIPIILGEPGIKAESIWDAWATDLDVIDDVWLGNPFPYQTKYKNLKRTFSKAGYIPGFVQYDKEISTNVADPILDITDTQVTRKISNLYYITYPAKTKTYGVNRYLRIIETADDFIPDSENGFAGSPIVDGIYTHPSTQDFGNSSTIFDVGISGQGDGPSCTSGIYSASLDVSRSLAIAQARFSNTAKSGLSTVASLRVHVRTPDAPDQWTTRILSESNNSLTNFCTYSRNDFRPVPESRFGNWIYGTLGILDGTTEVRTANLDFSVTSSITHTLSYDVTAVASEILKNEGDTVTIGGGGELDVFNASGSHTSSQNFSPATLRDICYASGSNIDSFLMVGFDGGTGNPTLWRSLTDNPTSWNTFDLSTITGIDASDNVRKVSFGWGKQPGLSTTWDSILITFDKKIIYLEGSNESWATIANASNWTVLDVPETINAANITYNHISRYKFSSGDSDARENPDKFIVYAENVAEEYFRFLIIGGRSDNPSIVTFENETMFTGPIGGMTDYNITNQHLYWAGFKGKEGEILLRNNTQRNVPNNRPFFVCLADQEPVGYSRTSEGTVANTAILDTTPYSNAQGARVTKPNYEDLLAMFYGFGDGFSINNILPPSGSAYKTTIKCPATAATKQTISFNYNRLESEQIMGPLPKGFRYGVSNVRSQPTKCIFRRDRFGQPRDMLEQRKLTKFVRGNKPQEQLIVTDPPVRVTFVSGSSAYQKANIYLTASLPTTFNPKDSGIYDMEYRSGQPFFDDQAGLDSGEI